MDIVEDLKIAARDGAIGHRGVRAYVALRALLESGPRPLSFAQISDMTSLRGRQTVSLAIRELVAAGLLCVEKRHHEVSIYSLPSRARDAMAA